MKPVYCTFCNRRIYNYSGPTDRVELKAMHFEPVDANFPRPTPGSSLECPLCGVRFREVSNLENQIRMLVDWRYNGTGELC